MAATNTLIVILSPGMSLFRKNVPNAENICTKKSQKKNQKSCAQTQNADTQNRWKRTMQMYKLAVIGHPLTQSLSAVMHNAMLNNLKLEGSYETLETQSEDLVDRIKYLKSRDYTGFNITIPLKVPVTLFLDEFDNSADIAGCANTVKILPDKQKNM